MIARTASTARKIAPALACAALATVALSGCRSNGEIIVEEGVGIAATRSACPAVGVPDYTGDVTVFRTAEDRSAANIDLTAALTKVRSQCSEVGENVQSTVTFDVLARRADPRGARQVSLPYYVTVLRGGTAVVSKRIGTVVLNFADGQERAQATAQGGAQINRAEATLPADIRERITRRRKAGDADAAIDPLSEPDVRAAVNRANFEVLVGFQLDQAQLAYNATR